MRDWETWSILCDFDGTISVEDITDSLLMKFARPGWERLEQEWLSGRIGSRECLSGQIAMLSLTQAELDAHLATRLVDPEFAEFVSRCRTSDVPLSVVSDGIDYAIRRILESAGLDDLPIAANQIRFDDASAEWRLSSPYASAHCRSGTCKCARADHARRSAERILLIGDGASDFCVAGRVDFVFAKGLLIDHCRESGIPYLPITGFDDALDALPRLLAGELLQPSGVSELLSVSP